MGWADTVIYALGLAAISGLSVMGVIHPIALFGIAKPARAAVMAGFYAMLVIVVYALMDAFVSTLAVA